MSSEPARLAAVVRAALAAPWGASPGALLHAPRVTALLASAADAPVLDAVVPPLLEVLERAGTGRGRVHVLIGDAGPGGQDVWRAVRARWGVPVIGCDPARATHWFAGHTTDGTALELDDELREAEALIALASRVEGESADQAGWRIVVPGFASPGTRLALARNRDRTRTLAEAHALVPLDALLLWDVRESPGAAWFGTVGGVQRALAAGTKAAGGA